MHGPGFPFALTPDRIRVDPSHSSWLVHSSALWLVAGRLCRMHMWLVAIAVFLLVTAWTNAAVDDPIVYSVRCWEAGSVFADPACSCLGGSARAKLDSRPTLTIVVGSWYAREAASLARPRAVESHFYRVSLEFGALKGGERGLHARRVPCAG